MSAPTFEERIAALESDVAKLADIGRIQNETMGNLSAALKALNDTNKTLLELIKLKADKSC